MFDLLILAVLIIVCLEIQITQGRQLKQHDFGSVQIQTGSHDQVHARKLEQKPGTQKHDYFLQVSESRELSRRSVVVSHISKGFQPTATGNSPGIGHSHVGGKDNMGPKMQEEFSTTAGGQSTEGHVKEPAGHSPGVGHSVGNLKKEPNA
ncbi:hypothetical protein Salat_1404400 [Sesamum alatum]|uniref:Uncharacterized protein n=1 Tax=Sesamum alatum TaxID=300844 RepID=A0AAE1YB18_9LAMI|nr:hypothetical protein Salat_1404400 [Sesamum alatum]